MPDTAAALRIFIIYAREDEAFRAELIGQLRPMEKAGQVRVWTDRDLIAGEHWDAVLKQQLRSADLILLLVSSDYFQSDYIHEVEIKEALERHRDGQAKVVPVIVRPCDWESDPVVSGLQILPTDGIPVADTRHWHTREAAWVDVVRGVRRTVQQLREERLAADVAAEAQRAKEAAQRAKEAEQRAEEAERIRQAKMAALAAQQEADLAADLAAEAHRAKEAAHRAKEAAHRAKEAAQAAERQRQAEQERQRREQEIARQEAEQAAWQTAQDPDQYAAYLAAYPSGAYAREARAALKKFRQAEKSGSGSAFPLWTVGAGVGVLLLVFVAYKVFPGKKPDGPQQDRPTQTAPVQTPPAPVGAEPDGSATAAQRKAQIKTQVLRHLNDADLMLSTGKIPQAKTALKNALQLDPDNLQLKDVLFLLDNGKTKQAADGLKKMLK